jgi:hypothetical protein|tara:strand:- start:59 stop:448 length:390 start_codon:yes stop_codon:yes gene_type:complete
MDDFEEPTDWSLLIPPSTWLVWSLALILWSIVYVASLSVLGFFALALSPLIVVTFPLLILGEMTGSFTFGAILGLILWLGWAARLMVLGKRQTSIKLIRKAGLVALPLLAFVLAIIYVAGTGMEIPTPG